MNSLVFYDDARARTFQPFALSRPQCEMRVGALLLRERWEQALLATSRAFIGAASLGDFEEFDAPPAETSHIPSGSILVNARAAITLGAHATAANVWTVDDRVAAVRLQRDLPLDQCNDGAISLEDIAAAQRWPADTVATAPGVWLDELWDSVRHLNTLLAADIPVLAQQLAVAPLASSSQGPFVAGTHAVYVESGAVVEPFSYFDTTLGPILLRRGAHVNAFTRIVGPCYVGKDSLVMADRISGSAIGDTCRVHGELSACILIGHSNKGHDGFVGHSVLGRWVNLGAGTTTSNLKNTYGTVALWTTEGVRDSGLQFLGTMFGDHVKTGIGLRLTTGCVLGTGSNVVDAMPSKVVAPFSWGASAPYDLFDEEKFIETAARMMQRRQVTLSDRARRYLRAIYRARWSAT